MDMHIVLVEPEIPPNTGNIARLCAAARATLHLVEPLGFNLDDARLKRAGLDYWRHLQWHRWPDWTAFQNQLPSAARLWLIESKGPRHYAEVRYEPGDYLDSVPTGRPPGVAWDMLRFKTLEFCPRWSNRVVMLAVLGLPRLGFGGRRSRLDPQEM
jgi:tRNA (cytidine(34)-2'-O)-methyltransferase